MVQSAKRKNSLYPSSLTLCAMPYALNPRRTPLMKTREKGPFQDEPNDLGGKK
jgi:hypothetical protein